MLTGIPGNFSQARLPPALLPNGDSSKRINTTLNTAIHFHRFISISKSTMEQAMYTQIPNSSAALWMMT